MNGESLTTIPYCDHHIVHICSDNMNSIGIYPEYHRIIKYVTNQTQTTTKILQ